MAITGKTWIPIEPGKRKTGALLLSLPEGSSQTYPRGALLIRSAGYIVMHTTSCVSVNLYGIAAQSGQNKTADGLAKAAVWKFEANQPFKAVVSGTMAQSILNSSKAIALSQSTDGHCFLITAAASSDSSVVQILDFLPPFAAGDTNPVVLFVPMATKIQEG